MAVHSVESGGRVNMTTTGQQAARRVTYQLETLWDFDYEPTHQELDTLYETAKKNQWNGSTAIDWSRPVGTEGAILSVKKLVPRNASFTLRTGPSVPTGRDQSIAVEPFH